MPTVLIADDEAIILKVLGRFLEKEGRTLLLARTGEEALELARTRGPVDAAVLDKNLGRWSGLEVGRQLKALDPDVEVILITGYGSLQSAIEAVQLGAYDYVTKPVEDFDGLGLKVANACAKAALARRHRATVAALEESEERFRSLFEASPDGIVAFDPGTGRIRQANRAAEQAFLREGGLAGLDVADLFAAPAPGQVAPPGERSVTGRRGDGSTFEAEIREGSFTLRGDVLGTLAIRDVSVRERLAAECRRVEGQLRHAQKLEATSHLAAGIGHDLGNMLLVVQTIGATLAREQPGSEDLRDMLVAADRAVDLVRQMTALSARGSPSPRVLSANDALAKTAAMLRRALGGPIQLGTELAPDLWPVLIDPGHLSQVLVNLALNARDAMPEGGRITFRSRRVVVGDHGEGRSGLAPGEYAALEVADTGAGMTAAVRERIFEPFFTTKEAGKGTGLGLAVSFGIVSQAGGAIEVESEPGRGSLFRVLLPRATPDEARAGEAAGAPAHGAPDRRVALVAEVEARAAPR